ncbi:MAG: hypothetical protein J7513_07195 [Solirubrobacteraceae bacterium]|nr:hypothetical protein [Solirubrobacteraceae bacterium]
MSNPMFSPPFATPTKRHRSLGDRIAVGIGVVMGLLIAAAIGGVLTVAYLTNKAHGDLTTATLSVSMADEVIGAAHCEADGDDSSVRRWTCTVQVWDYSGNFMDVKYAAADRGNDCWEARRGDAKGSLESGSGPPERLAACVHALQWASDHWLLD